MNRFIRFVILSFWLELGIALVLAPWSNFWDSNYFVFQFPAFALLVKNSFFRGAISGLGVIDIFLALESFRHTTTSHVKNA